MTDAVNKGGPTREWGAQDLMTVTRCQGPDENLSRPSQAMVNLIAECCASSYTEDPKVCIL